MLSPSLLVVVALAQLGVSPQRASSTPPAEPPHALLDTVLARHVHEGHVDYGALSRDRAALDAYLARR